MSRPDETYMSTGEFARLCQVKKQTLFHYDDIGLLPPAFVDDNGYRYYSYRQYETFVVIASLKETGMSLAQIREFMEQPTSVSRLIKLSKAYSDLNARIEHLTRVRRILGDEMNRARAALVVSSEGVDFEEMASQRLCRSAYLEDLDDDGMVRAVTNFSANAQVLYAALPVENILSGDFSRYAFLLAREADTARDSQGDPIFETYLRPAGTYAVIYHKGPYEGVGESYRELFDVLAERGMRASGYAYEEYLRNELSAASPDDYLTRISVLVDKD